MEKIRIQKPLSVCVRGLGGLAIFGIGFKFHVTEATLDGIQVARNTAMMYAGGFTTLSAMLDVTMPDVSIRRTNRDVIARQQGGSVVESTPLRTNPQASADTMQGEQ